MMKLFYGCLLQAVVVFGDDFAAFPQSLPDGVDVTSIAPVFDFSDNSCLPSLPISQEGDQNGGLNPSGDITGSCRDDSFLETSNTFHRYACVNSFCLHAFALYFEKDQRTGGDGTRHEFESVGVWTRSGTITHISVSQGGILETSTVSSVGFQGSNPKIIYNTETNDGSHRFNLASTGAAAANPYGTFVTPNIISWFEFSSSTFTNGVLRGLLEQKYTYSDLQLLLKDSQFLDAFNGVKPDDYPFMTYTAAQEPNPGSPDLFVRFQNAASGLCLNIAGGDARNDRNIQEFQCGTDFNELWYYEESTSRLRTLEDPFYCMQSDGTVSDGTNVEVYWCDDNPGSADWVRSGDQFIQGNFAVSKDEGGTDVRMRPIDASNNNQRWPVFGFPTTSPTLSPTTSEPTFLPTFSPSTRPTARPTTSPTTSSPSVSPTLRPTNSPTISPTFRPSTSPTVSPTNRPSSSPTASPTPFPTQFPTVSTNPTPQTSEPEEEEPQDPEPEEPEPEEPEPEEPEPEEPETEEPEGEEPEDEGEGGETVTLAPTRNPTVLLDDAGTTGTEDETDIFAEYQLYFLLGSVVVAISLFSVFFWVISSKAVEHARANQEVDGFKNKKPGSSTLPRQHTAPDPVVYSSNPMSNMDFPTFDANLGDIEVRGNPAYASSRISNDI